MLMEMACPHTHTNLSTPPIGSRLVLFVNARAASSFAIIITIVGAIFAVALSFSSAPHRDRDGFSR